MCNSGPLPTQLITCWMNARYACSDNRRSAHSQSQRSVTSQSAHITGERALLVTPWFNGGCYADNLPNLSGFATVSCSFTFSYNTPIPVSPSATHQALYPITLFTPTYGPKQYFCPYVHIYVDTRAHIMQGLSHLCTAWVSTTAYLACLHQWHECALNSRSSTLIVSLNYSSYERITPTMVIRD